jgi:hypothetical protein
MNPYAIIAALLVWFASLAGIGYWQNTAGRTAERVAWQERENTQLAEANAKIIELNLKARTEEREHADRLAAVSIKYQEDIRNEKRKAAVVIADLRAGIIRLRDPAAVQARGSGTGETSATSGRRDGHAGGELSPELAEFLVAEASRADEVARQLDACQAVVRADRGE